MNVQVRLHDMWLKRLFDVVASSAGLLVASPLALVVAILIKLDSRGPVFFRQWRIGRNENPFRIIKFRTMIADAEGQGPRITVGDDSRVTRFGRFLRRYHLDELPNLFNVLIGHMSIVGPRPELVEYLPHYSEQQREIFRSRPGLTDPATLEYRHEAELLSQRADPERFYLECILPRKIELGLTYLRRRSFNLDLVLILKTLGSIVDDARLVAAKDRILSSLLGHRRFVVLLVHVALFAISFVMAFLLRFDAAIPPNEQLLMWAALPLVVVIRGFVFAWFRLYQGLWRYVSLHDVVAIMKAVTLSSFVFAGAVLYVFGHGFPRAVIAIDWMLCISLVTGARMATRIFREWSRILTKPGASAALIVGAGDAGEMLLREIQGRLSQFYDVIGFVDDEPRLRGHRIHGIEVLGGIDELPRICRAREIDEVLIAIPSAGPELHERVADLCQRAKVSSKRVPTLKELLEGKARIGQLVDVRPEDLLGRRAVDLELGRLSEYFRGSRVLVTGGGGSIGSELARQVARFEPRQIVLLDRNESNLYFTALELKRAFPETHVVSVVGDILDGPLVDNVLQEHHPETIYHAAAYKHVPLMEEQPLEAIRNNVFGTETLALSALRHGVKKFVFISTDKAVNPVGIMGMTKRVAEFLLLSLVGETVFSTVRFGNVLGSDGSVLPLFKRQLTEGGPITVTDPDATRYFMLISEAAQLVLQAGVMARQQEIFWLDMGEPVRIIDLAHNLIRLYGLVPNHDVPVTVVGLRRGERLKEELITTSEALVPSGHDKILVAHNVRFDTERFRGEMSVLRRAVSERNAETAIQSLKLMATQPVAAESGSWPQYLASPRSPESYLG